MIVVNYATADLSIEAVESVLAHRHGGREVVVHLLDNASPGGDAAAFSAAHAARGWGDRVVLHLEAENHGFGRGNNVVLRRLADGPRPPDKVMLLNPDATLGNEAVAVLADFLDAHPDAGFAGARIEKPGAVPVTAAFRFPSFVGEVSGALAFGPVDRLLARWRVPLSPHLETGPVDWVAGAGVMARLDAIRAAGFFDPAYFLYYEEVDLMRAAAREGWRTWYVAEALVVHHEGAATGVRSGRPARRPAYWYDSWRHYFAKNHGRAYALATALARILAVWGNLLLARLRGRVPEAPERFVPDFWAVAVRPLIGLEARRHG